MSLSAEALAQLEGLDLQEARDGLNFVSAAGVREPLGADLSAEELSGLRSWDLSGVMAKLNSLTFEAVHPELVAVPAVEPLAPEPAPMPEPDAGVADTEIPEWLRPRESSLATEAPRALSSRPVAEEEAGAEGLGLNEGERGNMRDALAARVAGAGGKMRRFFESEKRAGGISGGRIYSRRYRWGCRRGDFETGSRPGGSDCGFGPI